MHDATQGLQRPSHRLLMHELKRRLRRITEVMPTARPVVYLDYPVHDNVGDLLIHQGADAFLEQYEYRVLGRFSMHDFARRGQAGEPTVVLKASIRQLDALLARGDCTLALHGGGNLGDIWPHFQFFRELIVQRYPDTAIVILPQSIHFGNPIERERCARVFAAHRKLHIFVRDTESLELVRNEFGGGGEIMPDMAHQLWDRPVFASVSAGNGTLVMRRRDKESRDHGHEKIENFDWQDLNSGMSRFLLRALRKWQTMDTPMRHVVSNYELWRIYRDRLIRRAIDCFRPYRCIDTDRLHGMILGALMSKDVRYGEGTYGKLHRYAQLWLAESKLIKSKNSEHAAK